MLHNTPQPPRIPRRGVLTMLFMHGAPRLGVWSEIDVLSSTRKQRNGSSLNAPFSGGADRRDRGAGVRGAVCVNDRGGQLRATAERITNRRLFLPFPGTKRHRFECGVT
jgi:hypothetical protein